jgi:hypothetical protein
MNIVVKLFFTGLVLLFLGGFTCKAIDDNLWTSRYVVIPAVLVTLAGVLCTLIGIFGTIWTW